MKAVQLYVAPLDAIVARPAKELRAFDKIGLNPGEEKPSTLHLQTRILPIIIPACTTGILNRAYIAL